MSVTTTTESIPRPSNQVNWGWANARGYVHIEDDGLYVKVIHFKNDGPGPAGESMWVIVTDGNELEGIGTVNNDPLFTESHGCKCGDLIRFGGGTADTKPHFIEKVEQRETA
jgi:hypothetical protein